MVASLLKVISSGIQDERLSFQRTLYPFRKVWRKAGRFTTQWGRLDFENTPQFGQTGFVRLLRKGHLITKLFLVAEMPDIYTSQKNARTQSGSNVVYPQFGWTNSLGHALVERLTLDIANERVETLTSRSLEMMDEFYTPLEKLPAVNRMICRADNGFSSTQFGNDPRNPVQRVIVPLPFWFCRGDAGCALPIDAIPMDDIRVGISFRGLNGLYYTDSRNVGNVSYADGSSLWPLVGSSFYTPNASGVIVPGLTDERVFLVEGVTMPQIGQLTLGECYILAEYVYIDQPEANRFRLADLQIPIVQHYSMDPYDTRGLLDARIRLDVPNPCRAIWFYLNRVEAPSYNAYFLATRDLNGNLNIMPFVSKEPWWPDAQGLNVNSPGLLRPAFALSNSEPVNGYEVNYEGSLVRYRTEGCSLFRSIISSYEQRKSPWINRYYYCLPLGIQNGYTAPSRPQGEANLDKIAKRELYLQLRSITGGKKTDIPRYVVYTFAETYNILRVYGGRAGLMFAY